jgi:L-ribulose-5-phosphate 4-epimerase
VGPPVLEELRNQVCEANRELARSGLVRLTWGDVSAIDRELGLVVISPARPNYGELRPEDHVVVDLRGRVVQGGHEPSPDTRGHVALYRKWRTVGGIAHTHSVYATMFAQARRTIPALGTMHSDYFHGEIRITRELRALEAKENYSDAAAMAILERAEDDPLRTPGILVSGDGPFAWGKSPMEAVMNAKALEAVAEIAFGTLFLRAGKAAFGRQGNDDVTSR